MNFVTQSLWEPGFRDVFGRLPISLVDVTTDYTQLQQTVEGYQQLHAVGLIVPAVGKAAQSSKLAKDLFDSILQVVLPFHGLAGVCCAEK